MPNPLARRDLARQSLMPTANPVHANYMGTAPSLHAYYMEQQGPN